MKKQLLMTLAICCLLVGCGSTVAEMPVEEPETAVEIEDTTTPAAAEQTEEVKEEVTLSTASFQNLNSVLVTKEPTNVVDIEGTTIAELAENTEVSVTGYCLAINMYKIAIDEVEGYVPGTALSR